MLGSMKTTDGDSYWLEECDGLYVMKQFPQKNFSPERAVISDLKGKNVSKIEDGVASDNTTQVMRTMI